VDPAGEAEVRRRTGLMLAALGIVGLTASPPSASGPAAGTGDRGFRGRLLARCGAPDRVGARFPGTPASALWSVVECPAGARDLGQDLDLATATGWATHRSGSSRPLADLALLRFLLGRIDRSVPLFETLHRRAPDDRRAELDLAAAYLARGRRQDSPRDVARALDLLDAGTSEKEGLFNRALALEGLFLYRLAQREWGRYLEQDGSSPWADVARRHSRRLTGLLNQAGSAASAASARSARSGATEDAPAALDRWIVDEGLPGWVRSVRGGDRDAQRHLEHRLVEHSERLAAIAGDRLAREEAVLLAAASGEQRTLLADGLGRWIRGHQALERYDFERARADLAASLPLLRKAGDPRAGWAEVEIAMCDFQAKRYDPSERRARGVLAAASAAGFHALEIRAAWTLANVALARLDLESALHWGRQAHRAARASHNRTATATANLLLGRVLSELGEPDQAWAHRVQGLRDLAALGDDRRRAVTIGNASFSLVLEGLPHAAVDFASEMLAFDQSHPTPLGLTESLWIRAQHRARVGDHRGALDDVRRAEDWLEQVTSPEAHARLLAGARAVEGSLLRTDQPGRAVERLSEALDYLRDGGYEYGQAEILLERARALRTIGRAADAAADLDEASRVVRVQRGRIAAPLLRLSFFDLQSELQDERVATITALGDETRAFRAADEARGLLFRESLGLASSPARTRARVRAGAPRTAAPTLHEDEALLLYWALPDRLLIWTVRGHGEPQVHRTTVARETLQAEIDGLVQTLDDDGVSGRAMARGAALYRRLLAPAERDLAGARRLIIVPDRTTRAVPWAALRARPDAPPMIERFALRVSPSASTSLRSAMTAPLAPISPSSSLVAVGDPTLPKSSDWIAPLPSARREVETLGAMFRHPALLVGDRATRPRLLAAIGRADVLHVASHFTAGRDAWSTRIELAPDGTDGHSLAAREVATLHLPHLRLAVLNGCATGREGQVSLGGTFSMAGAFLVAGADEVVASLWPVDDEPAERLITKLYQGLLAGLPTDEALRRAQLDLASIPNDSPSANGDWAAFTLVSLTLPRKEAAPQQPTRRNP